MTASYGTAGSSAPPCSTSGMPARWRATDGWNHGSTPRSCSRCRSHQATSIAVEVPGATAVAKASATTSAVSRLSACSTAISSGSRVSSQETASGSAGTRRSA